MPVARKSAHSAERHVGQVQHHGRQPRQRVQHSEQEPHGVQAHVHRHAAAAVEGAPPARGAVGVQNLGFHGTSIRVIGPRAWALLTACVRHANRAPSAHRLTV